MQDAIIRVSSLKWNFKSVKCSFLHTQKNNLSIYNYLKNTLFLVNESHLLQWSTTYCIKKMGHKVSVSHWRFLFPQYHQWLNKTINDNSTCIALIVALWTAPINDYPRVKNRCICHEHSQSDRKTRGNFSSNSISLRIPFIGTPVPLVSSTLYFWPIAPSNLNPLKPRPYKTIWKMFKNPVEIPLLHLLMYPCNIFVQFFQYDELIDADRFQFCHIKTPDRRDKNSKWPRRAPWLLEDWASHISYSDWSPSPTTSTKSTRKKKVCQANG